MVNNISNAFRGAADVLLSPTIITGTMTGVAIGLGVASGWDINNVDINPLSGYLASSFGCVGGLYGILFEIGRDFKEFSEKLESVKQDLNDVTPS
jgi:hypothetical protein